MRKEKNRLFHRLLLLLPKWKLLSILPIIIGMIFSIFLWLHIEDTVFFSGDGGLKLLLVKQYSKGDFSVYLHSQQEEWVDNIWESGFYPFEPPFVYMTPQGYLTAFPFLFQLLSVPFYLLFGTKGLYIIPLAALWILWIRCIALFKYLKIRNCISVFALSSLILSSPLTLYGAIFWEHTLGVLFTFFGVEFYFKNTQYSKLTASLYGVLATLSVWIRPEALIFVFLLWYILYVDYLNTHKKEVIIFLRSSVLTVFLFFLTNYILYKHILGAHSFQIVNSSFFSFEKLLESFQIAKLLLRELLYKFPLICFIIILAPFILKYKKNLLFLSILTFCFFCIAPFFLPNAGAKQWGPRYLLILLPIFTIFIAYQLELLHHFRQKHSYMLWGVFLACLMIGLFKNIYEGGKMLLNDYQQRIKPALEELQKNDIRYVLINSQYIAQELVLLYDKKIFFLTDSKEDLQYLTIHLKENQVEQMIYLTLGKPSDEQFAVKDYHGKSIATFNYKGIYGSYAISIAYLNNSTSNPFK